MSNEEIIEMVRKVADEATGCTEDECKYVEFSRSDFYKAVTAFARLIEAATREEDVDTCLEVRLNDGDGQHTQWYAGLMSVQQPFAIREVQREN
jgi:hypothetical protein